MELIERYLQEIGRRLPQKQRADILSELRSALMDTIEARFDGDFGEDSVVQVIKEMGPPKKVAESYHPAGQYLIGPTLYPTFQLVLGIVFTVIVTAQLVYVTVSLVMTPAAISLLDEFWGLLNSLPTAIGFVVLIFALLQRLEVQPEFEQEAFDPRKLPKLEQDDSIISRGEQVFGIIVGVAVLAFLAQFAVECGFVGDGFFANPVIDHYFPWIVLSMTLGIVIDIILLWRGRWQVSTRIARIGVNVFSMVVLFLLIQGHNAWLSNMGITGSFDGFFDGLTQLSENTELASQLVGMILFRLSLTIAFIVTAIETMVQLYRFVRARIIVNATKQMGLVSVTL
jgi:hypothetical protein